MLPLYVVLSTCRASAKPDLHSAVTSETFVAGVKSETISITDPGNTGNIGKNRKLHMAQSIQPGRFGQIGKPDDAWLANQEQEPILEPGLPIIDTHHHLWDRGGWTYLLPELLADLNTGHNIVATVFEECRSMYRAHGPVEMRPVGEVEFVAGIAAMSASGGYGPIKVVQGIVGFADLGLGDRVEPVLEALVRAGGGRFSGAAIRSATGSTAPTFSRPAIAA